MDFRKAPTHSNLAMIEHVQNLESGMQFLLEMVAHAYLWCNNIKKMTI